MAAWAQGHAEARLVLQGYLDVGEASAEWRSLGERRTRAVHRALVAAGVPADRIAVNTEARFEAACRGNSDLCRELNQRVEITVDRNTGSQVAAAPLRLAEAAGSRPTNR